MNETALKFSVCSIDRQIDVEFGCGCCRSWRVLIIVQFIRVLLTAYASVQSSPWKASWFTLELVYMHQMAGREKAHMPSCTSRAECWIKHCQSPLPTCICCWGDIRDLLHAYTLDSVAVLIQNIILIQTMGLIPTEVNDEFVCRVLSWTPTRTFCLFWFVHIIKFVRHMYEMLYRC